MEPVAAALATALPGPGPGPFQRGVQAWDAAYRELGNSEDSRFRALCAMPLPAMKTALLRGLRQTDALDKEDIDAVHVLLDFDRSDLAGVAAAVAPLTGHAWCVGPGRGFRNQQADAMRNMDRVAIDARSVCSRPLLLACVLSATNADLSCRIHIHVQFKLLRARECTTVHSGAGCKVVLLGVLDRELFAEKVNACTKDPSVFTMREQHSDQVLTQLPTCSFPAPHSLSPPAAPQAVFLPGSRPVGPVEMLHGAADAGFNGAVFVTVFGMKTLTENYPAKQLDDLRANPLVRAVSVDIGVNFFGPGNRFPLPGVDPADGPVVFVAKVGQLYSQAPPQG